MTLDVNKTISHYRHMAAYIAQYRAEFRAINALFRGRQGEMLAREYCCHISFTQTTDLTLNPEPGDNVQTKTGH